MDSGLNWEIAHTINSGAGQSPFLDAAARFAASDLIFFFVLFALLWWLLPIPDDQGKSAVIAAGIALAGGVAISLIIGHLFYVPRPFVSHQVLLLTPHAPDYSFPSDHTTVASAVAMTGVYRRLPGRWLALGGTVLIAFARVFVGVHYPADVIGGFLVGALVAAIILRFDAFIRRSYRWSIAYLLRTGVS